MKTRHPHTLKRAWLATSLLFVGSISQAVELDLEGLSAEEAGLAIAEAADKKESGFGNTTSDMKMILINRQGEKHVRNMRSRTYEMEDDGDRSLTIFDEPADVKGTAMLTHAHGLEPDDQWLYLPALKRVKRISSRNKSGPFMGSEFAYEDLGSQEVEKYSYKLLGEETANDLESYKIERTPEYKHSGYTKQISWIDKEELRSQKVEYYDRKGELLKTLKFGDYQQYQDQYWRPGSMFMENHQTGKATELQFTNYVFGDESVREADFTSNALRRIR
ncbi:MAG: outer membrane lipoprotein-sorting protein [Pseudomonadota bacterium]